MGGTMSVHDKEDAINEMFGDLERRFGWDDDACLNQAVAFIAKHGMAAQFIQHIQAVQDEHEREEE
jgi:hypothetical protein